MKCHKNAELFAYVISVVDIVQVLTESADGRKYWNKLKQRLLEEGNETVTNCHQLKLPSSDGKRYLTDVADLQGIFRIIQSIPSKKAEPVKQWLAQLGEQTAKEGGEVARSARADIESRLGHSVISSERASDYLRPIDDASAQELPFDEGKDD